MRLVVWITAALLLGLLAWAVRRVPDRPLRARDTPVQRALAPGDGESLEGGVRGVDGSAATGRTLGVPPGGRAGVEDPGHEAPVEEACTVGIRVVDRSGRIVSRASAVVWDERSDRSSTVRVSRMDRDGTVRIPLTVGASVQVTIVASGFRTSDPIEVVATPGALYRVTLDEGWSIEGVVHGLHGKPVAGIPVIASVEGQVSSYPPDHSGMIATSDAAGRFHVSGLEDRTYSVHALAVSDAGRVWVPRPRIPAGTTGLILRAEPERTLRGRLVVPSDEPLGEISLHVGPARSRAAWNRWPEAKLDSEGNFEIGGLWDQEYELHVRHARWVSPPLRGLFPPRDDLVVRMERGLSITGNVMLPPTWPPSWSRVECRSLSDPGRLGSTTTVEGGYFSIGGLHPGRYSISVRVRGYKPVALEADAGARGLEVAVEKVTGG